MITLVETKSIDNLFILIIATYSNAFDTLHKSNGDKILERRRLKENIATTFAYISAKSTKKIRSVAEKLCHIQEIESFRSSLWRKTISR